MGLAKRHTHRTRYRGKPECAVGRVLSGGTALQFLKVYSGALRSVYVASATAPPVVESLSFRRSVYMEPVNSLAMVNLSETGQSGTPDAVAFVVVVHGALLLFRGCDVEHQTVVFR